jgi:ComF family protein
VKALRTLAGLLGDAFWPRSCIVCDSDEEVGAGDVCAACWSRLAPSGPVDLPRDIASLRVGFAYDDRLRRIVHRFKFEGVRELAAPLARALARALHEDGERIGGGVLLPVPDHPARRRERGFNPAAELARELGVLWGLESRPGLASRITHGPHQSSLPEKERRRALSGAFNVLPPGNEYPRPRLILVDDVVATGTTLRRLAKQATRAGWNRVEAICLCA